MIVARTSGIAGTVIGLTVATALVAAPARAATVVTDWAALSSAFFAGGEVVLGAAIAAPSSGSLAVRAGDSVELDLHGHALTITDPGAGFPAIGVPTNSQLTIDDSVDDATINQLTVRGGSSSAGIGGGNNEAAGSITVQGDAIVDATGGDFGAGIGGGGSGTGGTVVVTGISVVTARGGQGAAGIGGGAAGNGGTLRTHDASTVTASGGRFGAGIGGGTLGGGGSVVTNGASTVAATGGDRGAGIGGGNNGAGGTVHLRGSGVVSAQGGAAAAAVGGAGNAGGATVTVGASATLEVPGGIAFGPGADPTTWGSLTNAGTITLAEAATLSIPDGVTVANPGTIINEGAIQGTGTIANTGRIVGHGSVANDGHGGSGTTVSTHSFRLFYDYGGVGEEPPPLTVFAATAAAGDRTLGSAPGDDDHVFTGWYTAAPGGTQVTDSSNLPDLFGDGPVAATLHARYDVVQRISFSSTAPTDAVVGGTYAPAVTGGDSGEPVTLAIDPATTDDACALVDDTIHLRHAGTCVITADQAAAPGYTAAETATQSLTVRPAATTLALDVTGTALTATVSSPVPGPVGSVTFSVDGAPVGSAELVDGVARLGYVVPSGQARTVSASYAGQGDHTGSADARIRRDPVITAAISSAPNARGWHRTPVTVSFVCTPDGAPLASACPAPVTLGAGRGQSVSRSVAAADGGAAAAAVSGISVDLTAPTVKLARKGKRVRCLATDALSGVASCKAVRVKKLRGGKVRYRATAIDQAGNTTVRTVTLKPGRRR